MDGRIVISFRATAGAGRHFVERARALSARAADLGGVIVAWDATKIAFAVESAKLADVLSLAAHASDDSGGDHLEWAVGLAEGSLTPLAMRDAATLAWGPPLVAASLLASAARPGEILCAETVRALRAGELLATGTRVAREGDLRVRGVRLARRRPWRSQAVAELSRLRAPPLVGRSLSELGARAGALTLVRGKPGAGGTRLLAELAKRAPRALFVPAFGSAMEPFGALRRALARSISRELPAPLLARVEQLERLLAGEGVDLDVASRLVSAILAPSGAPATEPSLLLLDDVSFIDSATIEACVRAARRSPSFGIVARLDADSAVPATLAELGVFVEATLGPLAPDAARAIAGAATGEALDDVAKRRWSRLGGGSPLGVVEALAFGIASGEIDFDEQPARPRTRGAGRGKVRTPADWIKLRAADEPDDVRTALCVLALLGGEAKIGLLERILHAARQSIATDRVVEYLLSARWVESASDALSFASRTHVAALSALLDEAERTAIHRAASDVIEREEGTFGRAEAAWHAVRGGETMRASRILLEVVRAAADLRLASTAAELVDYARAVDPSCDDRDAGDGAPDPARSASNGPVAPDTEERFSAEEPDSSIIERAVIISPEDAAAARAARESEPPTLMNEAPAPRPPAGSFPSLPPLPNLSMMPSAAPPTSAAASMATRLGDLAKEALVAGDNSELERWLDERRAAGESLVLVDRMRAMARLGRGEIGDALRVLRRTRAELDPKDHAQRCQTSLAMAVALSVAGRPQDALLEALDALARARQIGDRRAASACLAFLAKLYAAVGRGDEADKLKASAS